jgi:tetratricopeptide (TPR) repeat protein
MTNSINPITTLAGHEWTRLEDFSASLAQSGMEPGSIPNSEWQIIEDALNTFVQKKNWTAILRLRTMFSSLYARDTMTGLDTLQALDQQAIRAARYLGDTIEIGHLLGARGHNLHRQGYHKEAIKAFDESAQNYRDAHRDLDALKSFYMTSLCYRALGKRNRAKQILNQVLANIDPQDPWRGNPLQVLAWIHQDEGRLKQSEQLLREALNLFRQTDSSDMLIVGVLADLGEVSDILGRPQEAAECFEKSLSILTGYQGQYDRQEARTLLKYCEFLIHQKEYDNAMTLLNRADDKVSSYGHYYDLLWQIELAKALIYLLEGEIKYCVIKIRSVFRIRKILELPYLSLVQQVSKRFAKRLLG